MSTPPVVPAPPVVIPVGIASRLMALVGAAFAVVAAVTAISNGEVTADTVYFAVISAVNFVTLAAGRYTQAAFALLANTWGISADDPVVPDLGDAGSPDA